MPTTLLVEGDDALATLLQDLLSMELGHRLVRARDCDQAWRLFQQQTPDALLLDLAYPYQDGLDLCDRVLAMAAVPVVVLTSRPEEALADRPTLTVLSKPFEVADLLQALRAAVTPASLIINPAPQTSPPM
jgi:DNA-binding response OmpR family regulator